MPAERLSWCATTEPTPLERATTTESMQKITNEAGKILHATSKTTQPKSVNKYFFLKTVKEKVKLSLFADDVISMLKISRNPQNNY